MVASDIRAGARGVLPRPFDMTHLDVTLSLAGKDLADGYYLTGLALPNTPPYSISGRLRLVGTKYEFTNVQGRLGGSDVHGVITVQLNSVRPVLDADLTSHSLNLADLGPTFGGAAPSGKEEAQAQHAKGHPTQAATKHALATGIAHGITGLGGVDLRNERLNLQLTGKPKKFRFAVLRTPVEIKGTLRHPAVGLKGSKLAAQGAAATALGVIGTPLAAIAAFVDPGLNKSADCQALLTDAKSMGAPLRTATASPRKRRPEHKKR